MAAYSEGEAAVRAKDALRKGGAEQLLTQMLLLAETGPMMGNGSGTAILACLIAIPAVAVGLCRRWLFFLVVPIVLLFNFGFCVEFTDPTFGPCIVRELGYGWMAREIIAWNLPLLIAFIIVLSVPRVYREPGCCRKCGYLLRGLTEPRCPKCGSAFSWGGSLARIGSSGEDARCGP